VAPGEHGPDELEQVRMQGLLLGREGYGNGLRLAHGEAADVAAAGPVDQRREGVEPFKEMDQGQAILRGRVRSVQPVVGGLGSWIGGEDVEAPGRGDRCLDGPTGALAPSRTGTAHGLDGGVDVWVGLGHLLVLAAAGQQVGAEQVEQVIEIRVAELNRSGGEKDNGLRVVAQPADSPIDPGLRVADVMGLVNDNQIECRRRIQVEQNEPGTAALSVAHQ
jgi:hypothetical protein